MSSIGTPTKPPSALGSLFRIVVFRRLWGAITLSSLGDWLGLLATTALAAYLTRDSSSILQGTAISAVLVTRLLPDLIFGPVAGSLVDRFDRRTIAISCDLVACVLYLVIAFGHNLTVLLVGQFLVEAVGLFSTPAKQAMWVNIVPRERLAVANQLNYVSIYGMVPVAAVIFALLSTVSQFFASTPEQVIPSTGLISGNASSTAITIALVFNAATFAVTSSVLYFSRRMIPSFVGERSTTRSVFSLIREGISFVKNSSVMRALYLGILGAFGAGGLVAGVAQSYVATLGAGNAGYGILFGSVFTGLALGMLVGPKVLPAVPRRVVFTVCVGLAGAMLLLMSLVPDFVGAVITAAAMGLAAGVAWITGFTMIGHEVSDQLRGRVFAFVMSSVRLTLLGAIAVGPVLAGAIGGHTVTIGAFVLAVSGPGIVLAIGGLVAIVVSLIAGRQVGGIRAGIVSRMVRRRRLLAEQHDRPGVLIAVEGCDRAANSAVAEAVSGRMESDGWRTALERGDSWPESAYSSLATALRATADLADTLQARVEPELSTGAVVVYQDYLDSVVVRFGAQGGLDEERLLRVGTWVTRGAWPDLTILVDPGSAPVDEEPPDSEVPGTLEIAIQEADAVEADASEIDVAEIDADDPDAAETEAARGGSAVASVTGVDPEQAFRERAASAPERYLRIPPLTGEQRAAGELPEEVLERIASVLRLRTPVRATQAAI
ncbi:MAG: MFS transporter [Actinomycetota bacterium]|nr:MFS transporter [Actinomycetota bacterium]